MQACVDKRRYWPCLGVKVVAQSDSRRTSDSVVRLCLGAKPRQAHDLNSFSRAVNRTSISVTSSDRTCVEIKPMISAASPGDRHPAAQLARTEAEALSASAAVSIFGRSNVTGRSRLGGNTRSRQSSRIALQRLLDDLTGNCLRFAVKQRFGHDSGAIARPLRPSLGIPLERGGNGRPRCIGAVFSPAAGVAFSMLTSRAREAQPCSLKASSRHRTSAVPLRRYGCRDYGRHGLATAFGARLTCRSRAQAAQAEPPFGKGGRRSGLPDRDHRQRQGWASSIQAPVGLASCRG